MTPCRSDLSPELIALIEANLDRVKIIAHRFRRYLPASVDFEELVSCGNLRLVECAYRFDSARASFGTFAAANIEGAMLDYLRSLDLASHRERHSGTAPDRRGIPLDGIAHLGKSDHGIAAAEARADIAKLLPRLQSRPRYIVEQRYLKERSDTEIGDELGFGQSWIVQLRLKALRDLRAAA